jgi:hypothetical protein
MSNGNGVPRGDRHRNARLSRPRELVPACNAIVGIDLADNKQMVVVADYDSKVLARRTFRSRAWDLGLALDWAGQHASKAGFAGVTVACEPTGHRWRVLGQLAADRGMAFVCVQTLLTSWARRSEDLTFDKTDEKDAVLIARLTAQLRCYVPEPPRIGGIFKPNALLGSYLAGSGFFHTHFSANILPGATLLATSTGATPATTTSVKAELKSYPNLTVQTRAKYVKTAQAQVNQLLGLVYALLALAILIALIGIVNTLMLSVFERTHEIGLLRAVGMRRRQIRAMIGSEAVILSVFGALIGIVIGTGLGVAQADSLKQQGITDLVILFSSLAVFLVLAALLGLGAASWPARRAARLNVLEAIATD